MRRREFISLLGCAAATWPALAHAQQNAKLPTVGYLGPNSRLLDSQRLAAFVQRWAEGRNEHLAEIAADFVRRKVDIIVTSATPPTVD